ncbi:hypothetical protein ACFK7R_000103 [Campylobacter jejuni]
MITKDNLKQVLENLGFKNKNENYVKTINNYTLVGGKIKCNHRKIK